MPVLNRKEELEIKKAKLAALRAERLQKEVWKNSDENLIHLPSNLVHNKVDTDGILQNLGIGVDGKTFEKSTVQTPVRRIPKLVLSDIKECSFSPMYDEKYSKDTQTTEMTEIHCETSSIATDTYPETPSVATRKGLVSLEWDDDLLEVDEDDLLTEQDIPPIPNPMEIDKNVRIQELSTPLRAHAKNLSDEDKENIQSSGEFVDFVMRVTGLVEAALEIDDRDIFFDYSGADKADEMARAQRMLTEERVFFDADWTSRRTVTAIEWSPLNPDVLLAAYSQVREDEMCLSPVGVNSTPNGVCLLWNLKSRKGDTAPESIFTCQEPITTAILSDFHPNLIIAGTYVGHVVLWDTRVNRQTPVQRTGMAGSSGHVEPIVELAVTGNATANNLVSVSAEGRLCAWSLDMLANPLQTVEMIYKQAKTIVPTSIAFARDFDDTFLIGAQDGFIYGGSRVGSEPGVGVQFEGHKAPVTAVTIPTASNPLVDSSLYLTTSMDCTVKLWSKDHRLPLVSFEDRSDYFLDCDWSPSHPALFATVDLGGHLDIWNLNMSSEVPITSTVLDNDAVPNCCRFQSNGTHIGLGDDTGRIRVFGVNDKISAPHPDEWTMFESLIGRLTVPTAGQSNLELMAPEYAISSKY